MAWPCISRVCCLARFWNQFDKSDLSVPLTIQNYSDIAEQEVRSVAKQVSAPGNHYPAAELRGSGSPQAHFAAAGPRGSFRARKEPSYKPREDYQPPGVPFPSVTQYKQDFKPWPIPRKDNFPWINGGSRVDGVTDAAEDRGKGQQQGPEEVKTSSYRQEYRPWAGVRPTKSARKPHPAQYSSPVTEVSRETSYQAAYSGEGQRSIGQQQGGCNMINSASSTNMLPVSVPQPAPSTLHAGSGPTPSSLQQSIQPELSGTHKVEEHLVRTKLSPNPSAVFQSGPRVFNI